MKLSDKAYIIMKWSSLLAIPLVTLVLSISDAIGWNAGSVVAAIISALGVFAGAVIKISNDNYYNNGDE
ncbi:MAG: hypothetical protein IKD75_08510 [Prevotella sp.]|nr:hypothetical protein [Prevotella sp.]